MIPIHCSLRYGTWLRVRDIMIEAPWSNHDLLTSLILLLMGSVFFVDPETFSRLRALAYLSYQGHPLGWALLFFGCGAFQLAVTLWCICPPFLVRLLARMGGAFCFVLLAHSSALFSLTAPSMIVYSMLALWSLWSIARTKISGR